MSADFVPEAQRPDLPELEAPYEPKPAEKAVLKAVAERQRARPPAPRFKVEKKGRATKVKIDHPDPPTGGTLLMESLGTGSPDFADRFVTQLANAASAGQTVDTDGLNFMLAVVNGIKPKDEIEAMLAGQMAAVHIATMTFARRLNHVENIPQQDSAERTFNKLARTFATQMEALKRYRSEGQQTVRVERVTVSEGGQAIVGAVTQTGGGGGSR